jgi:hypothetical protein
MPGPRRVDELQQEVPLHAERHGAGRPGCRLPERSGRVMDGGMADRPIGQPLYKVNPGDTEQSALVSSRWEPFFTINPLEPRSKVSGPGPTVPICERSCSQGR